MANSFDQVYDRRGTQSLKWTRYGTDVLPLWVADMDFPAPEPARQALRRALEHGIFGYEMPSRRLAEVVAGRMQHLYGWAVSPEAVVATPGIVAGFHAAARALCNPGQGVLVQPPVYPPFLHVPEHTNTMSQLAPLVQANQSHTLRYEIDWQAFEAALNSKGVRTGMFLLCHPHNPTGQSYRRADLERMAELCLRNRTFICSDEVHSELLLGGSKHLPLASLAPEIAEQTITLVSPSKTFNLVGLFCGFALIPNADLRARYRKVLQDGALHVNSLGLIAAEAAFSGACESWLEGLRQYLTGNRDLVVEFVRQHLPGVRVTVPEATYLAWLDFGELMRQRRFNASPYEFLLEQAKVALNPGADFGPGAEDFVRLNFGCPRATLTDALHGIRDALLQVQTKSAEA